MRKVVYSFMSGAVTTSSYATMMNLQNELMEKPETILIDIPEPIHRTPVRQAMIDQFGYVSPTLKDKVILD